MGLQNLLQFFLSAALIWLAARWLVKASDEIAKTTGLGHLFVGSLFLAASTSAPEFFVDIEATQKGIPDLAAGDLLGSSLINLTIFCILSLISWKTINDKLTKKTRLLSWLAALLTAEVGIFILFGLDFGFWNFSLPSIIIAATYLIGLRSVFEKQQANSQANLKKTKPYLLFKPLIIFFSATLLIFFASPYLVLSVEAIADQTSLGKTLIGTSLLALTTSFPELSSSIIGMRKGLFQLVAGNIIGSNAINMVIFVVMDGIWKEESLWTHLSKKNLVTAGFVTANMILLASSWNKKSSRCWVNDRTKTWLILLLSISCYVVLYFLRDMNL